MIFGILIKKKISSAENSLTKGSIRMKAALSYLAMIPKRHKKKLECCLDPQMCPELHFRLALWI